MFKHLVILVSAMFLLNSPYLVAQSVPDVTKSVGNLTSLQGLVTSQLKVTDKQADGGIGSILTLAQEKLSPGDFSTVSKAIPGTDNFLKAAKDTGAVTGKVGDKKGLDSAFSRLDMKPDMVGKFVPIVAGFAGKAGGNAKDLLMNALK